MKRTILVIALFVGMVFGTKAQSLAGKNEFNNTLKAYFETKNALAKDNSSLAGEKVENLLRSLTAFPVKTLSSSEQALWVVEADVIKKAATAMSTEKAIKEQRKSFWPISSSIIKLAKAFNRNSETVYVQYCPMAKKSWLNEVEAVQNPFYGSMMYDCGEVTETIVKK